MLKQTALIFDCVRYGLFALSVPIVAGVEYGLLAKEGKLYPPHVSALILFVFYFVPLIAHFIIELIRLIQTRKMDKSIVDVFGNERISAKCH